MTGKRNFVPATPDADRYFNYGRVPESHAAVVCAASHNDHGDCHSCPFFIVWVFTSTGYSYASRYSSENGTWDPLASSPTPSVVDSRPSVLVENVLYWPLKSKYILAYELGTCSLYHIECPPDKHNVYRRNVHIVRTENGGPGLAAMTEFNLRLWAWKTDAEGVSGWVLCKIIDLDAFLPREVSPLPSTRNHLAGRPLVRILGFVEDDDLVFLWTIIGVFAVQLKSMQFKVVFEADVPATIFPYTGFYSTGAVGGNR